MTIRDRLENTYMVNFIDHRSSYCRIFMSKSKDAAASKFKLFMGNCEHEFNCRIHVLRTDGGGEYKTLDFFCSSEGVSRQVNEAKTKQATARLNGCTAHGAEYDLCIKPAALILG